MPNPPVTTASAAWLELGTVVDTHDGIARVVSRPNVDGACRIRFPNGMLSNLATHNTYFQILPAPTGPLLYLCQEFKVWAANRDAVDREETHSRRAWEDSDLAGLLLLAEFAKATGLIQPADGEVPKGPICTVCLATGWSFADLAVPVWCDACRGTGYNAIPELAVPHANADRLRIAVIEDL